jgi:hypothetical protein
MVRVAAARVHQDPDLDAALPRRDQRVRVAGVVHHPEGHVDLDLFLLDVGQDVSRQSSNVGSQSRSCGARVVCAAAGAAELNHSARSATVIRTIECERASLTVSRALPAECQPSQADLRATY